MQIQPFPHRRWPAQSASTRPDAFHRSLLVIALILALLAPPAATAAAAAAAVPSTPGAPDAAGASWQGAAPLGTPRSEHTSTLLPNGKLLVVGGNSSVAAVELYDAATGAWSATDSLTYGRYRHTATLLPDGRVLVAAGQRGSSLTNSAELYSPTTGLWSTASALHTSRRSHTATLLLDGKLLVVGGANAPLTGAGLASVERYDPATGQWDDTRAALNRGRYNHTATLLADGRVLVAGGVDGSTYLNTSEIYDPAANTWTTVADNLDSPHMGHSATRLNNGKVLLAGGYSGTGYPKVSELFDPATNQWSGSGALTTGRAYHGVVLLPSGYVLAAGGYNGVGVATAEMYAPDLGTWFAAGSISSNRYNLTLTSLPNGKLLAAGGYMGAAQNTVEIYSDPALGTWANVGAMSSHRYRPSTTLLANGDVLVAGGYDGMNTLNTAALYSPSTSAWAGKAAMHDARWRHSATLLPGQPGSVLVVGGRSAAAASLASVELYDWNTNTWTVKAPLSTARNWHTATLLPEGRILVVGGLGPADLPLANAELYDPAAGAWTTTPAPAAARYRHTATLLDDGRVLVVGGFDAADAALKSSEIYDPVANTWTATGALGTGRSAHTASLLPGDGAAPARVMVAGGRYSATVAHQSVEIYNPASGTWSYGQALNYARSDHSATLLRSGRVLVAGGFNSSGTTLNSSEVYDPAGYPVGGWSLVGSMMDYRAGHTATLLFTGQVLLTGGLSQNKTEVFNQVDGVLAPWRPSAASSHSSVALSRSLNVVALGLRGYQNTEGSSGGASSSPANYPLIQLRRIDNEQMLWLSPTSFTVDSYVSQPLQGILSGPAMLTVFVNGIAGTTTPVDVNQLVTLEVSAPTISYYQDGVVQVKLTTARSLPLGKLGLKLDGGAFIFQNVTPVYGSSPASATVTFTLNKPAIGLHSLLINYSRQGYLSPSSFSTTLLVNKAPTRTTLAANPAAVKEGEPVQLAATVLYDPPARPEEAAGPAAPDGGGPTGAVLFKEGDIQLGQGQINGSTASFTANLAPGVHWITAVYAGDSFHATSTSTTQMVVVGQPPIYLPVVKK